MSKYINNIKWLNMSNRRLLHSFTELFKINNNLSPSYLSSLICGVSDVHDHNTRQRGFLYGRTSRTTTTNKSFFFKIPVLFNALPNYVKQASSVSSFKTKCRNYLMSTQFTQL